MAHRPIPVFIALALFVASIGIEAATAEHYRQWVEQK